MDDDRTIQIALQLEVRGDEVRGTAQADDSPRHDFTGWLGLIAALDTIVAAPAPTEGVGD